MQKLSAILCGVLLAVFLLPLWDGNAVLRGAAILAVPDLSAIFLFGAGLFGLAALKTTGK